MDPVSISFAAVKVAISAVEHYSQVANSISLYRNYSKEIKTIVRTINVRQTIFRHAVQALLTPCIDEDEAFEMLNDAGHTGWKDPDVKAHIGDRIARSSDAFEDSIALVISNLQALAKIGEDCGWIIKETNSTSKSVTSKKDPSKPISDDSKACRSVKEKIWSVFADEEVDDFLNKLRDNTEAFRTLVEQTEREERTHVSKLSLATRQKMRNFTAIKEAAGNLYEALGSACTKHTEHRAHLSLKIPPSNTKQVKFTIAFTQTGVKPPTSLPGPRGASEPVWLTVESAVTGTIQSPTKHDNCSGLDVLNALQLAQKRPRESTSPPPTPAPRKKLKKNPKKVAFAATEPVTPLSIPAPMTDLLPNFCSNSNFCNQLQKFLAQAIPSCDHPVGYLHCPGEVKHLIYIRSKTQSISTRTMPTLVSLHDLFSQAYHATQPESMLQQHQRISLAKQLATAVLQFQATPWLEKSWDSNHILISGTTTNPTWDTTQHLLGPAHESYIKVAIKSPHIPPSRPNTYSSRTLISNGLLFRLGVMLLELAFQQPLSQLRTTADMDEHNIYIDYFTADRVQRCASARLGPRYAEVVRKCIKCDFRHGEDLGLPKLQEGFY